MSKSSYVINNNFEYTDSDQTSVKSIYTLANVPAAMLDNEVFNLLHNHTDGGFTPDNVHCQCPHDCCGRWYQGQAEVIRNEDKKPVQVIQGHWLNC